MVAGGSPARSEVRQRCHHRGGRDVPAGAPLPARAPVQVRAGAQGVPGAQVPVRARPGGGGHSRRFQEQGMHILDLYVAASYVALCATSCTVV